MDAIDYSINYIKYLEGVKYLFPDETNSFTNWNKVRDIGPFWLGKNPLPRNDLIIRQGICCVGLINLMRRKLNLSIPSHIDSETKEVTFIGGTSGWFQYLNNLKRLKPINIRERYPRGTLLIQDYNPIDQGHVAVILSNNKLLFYSKKIHAIGGDIGGDIGGNIGEDNINSGKYNRVIIEKFNEYPYWQRYTHVCLPQDWLLKN